ncbi:hypothetical protein ACFQZE_00600 [Paenibacillus sp. GCM10027627]|uniref:hypothetical protein n=1 Tax=unclassified Paenibacillus TaxID=185978 RepID=UPI0036358029
MKKGNKWLLTILLLLTISASFICFYLEYYQAAFAIAGLFTIALIVWGTVLRFNNEYYMGAEVNKGRYMSDKKTIEEYTR